MGGIETGLPDIRVDFILDESAGDTGVEEAFCGEPGLDEVEG